MAHNIRHVRQQAKKHHEAHERLKDLLNRILFKEKVWDVFAGGFVATIVTVIIFMNWGNIVSFFGSRGEEMPPAGQEVVMNYNGFRKGVIATYQINGQTADQYIRYVRQIDGQGHMTGVEAVAAIGKAEEKKEEIKREAFLSSIFLSTDLSKGNHLTALRQGGRLLQKSILATFYLGAKTVDINSTLQTDSKLLSQISNTLSVDLFAYLNQSNDRATSLDNFLNLLETLLSSAQRRSAELQSKINFLSQNFDAQERTIQLTEDAFFQNLQIFEGENAEEELGRFIGLQQDQSEIKAKIGAYQGLKDYYGFFIPRLDNLIRAIRANRDPLIAGVKVVEIQNMTLPLIIRGE
jgi:hypothetical protein